MAVNLGTLFIKIDADKKKFDKGIKAITKDTKKLAKTIKIGFVAASAAIAATAGVAIKAAADQEKAEARLVSIAKTVTKATDEQIESMKNLAKQYQKVSTFGDEVIVTGQSQLLSFGLTAQNAEKLTGSLVDLLAANKGVNATTQDAIDAANLLGKAYSGLPGSLSRVGILLNDTQSELLKNGTEAEKTAALVEILEQNYGGLAETLSQTTEGQLKQAKNAFGDILEVIGNRFLPVLNDLLSWVLANMPEIQRVMVDVFDKVEKVMMFVINNAKLLTTVLASLLGAFAAFKILTGVIALMALFTTTTVAATTATTAATAAATLFGIAIGGWVLIVAAAIGALVALALNWDSVTESIGKAINAFLEFAGLKEKPFEDTQAREREDVQEEFRSLKTGQERRTTATEARTISRAEQLAIDRREQVTRGLETRGRQGPAQDEEALPASGNNRRNSLQRGLSGANIQFNIQSNDPDFIGSEIVRRLNMQGLT